MKYTYKQSITSSQQDRSLPYLTIHVYNKRRMKMRRLLLVLLNHNRCHIIAVVAAVAVCCDSARNISVI